MDESKTLSYYEHLRDFVQPLQLIIDTIPQAVFWKDRESVYVWCNRNFAIDSGVGTPENIIGKTDFELPWTKAQAAQFREIDKKVMANGKTYNIVEQLTLANGQLIWCDTNKVPLYDEQGNVAGILGIYRDITERKYAQEALRESQDMLRLIMDNIPQSIFWKDRNSLYLGCNQTFAQQAGLASPDEIVGKSDYDLAWGKDQAELYRQMDRRVMDANTPEYHIIEPQTRSDGRGAWLDTNKIPLHNTSGNVVGILGTYEDITDRKESEEALKKAHDELERLVEAQTAELSTATAQLKEQINQRKRSQLAEQEQRTLAEALRDTAALINGSLQIDEVLDHILAAIERVVPHDSASIVLIEGEMARTVRVRSEADHLPMDHEKTTLVPIEQLPNYQHIIKARQPFILQNTTNSAVWIEQVHAPWVRSYLGVPIQVEDEVIGLINLHSATTGFFGPVQAERLQAFADQAAIAIQNARLYERAHELAAIQERQRLARDLHDAVSQTLWTASLMADVLPTLWVENQAEGERTLEKFRRLTRGALAEMRTLLLELRPTALVETRLEILLDQLAEATMSRKKLNITLDVEGDIDLPEDIQVGIYRIAQEAMNNVAKHARATDVNLKLSGVAQRVQLIITDNGRGFDLNNLPPERLGVKIMRERAESIQAELRIKSDLGKGTEIVIEWPQLK